MSQASGPNILGSREQLRKSRKLALLRIHIPELPDGVRPEVDVDGPTVNRKHPNMQFIILTLFGIFVTLAFKNTEHE